MIKNRKIVLYGVFGLLTIALNLLMYLLFTRILSLPVLVSSVIAVATSVIFAYFINNKFVYKQIENANSNNSKKIGNFFIRTGFGVILDFVVMFAFLYIFTFDDIIVKLTASILVVILNYFIVMMWNLMIRLLIKYKEIVIYGVFGLLTTAVNYLSYLLFTRIFMMPVMVSTLTSTVLSIVFAYITNRKWVFNSQVKGAKNISIEFGNFFVARLFGMGLEFLIMFIFVNMLEYNDLVVKLLANIFVIILNYFISKLLVFRKRKNIDEYFDDNTSTL